MAKPTASQLSKSMQMLLDQKDSICKDIAFSDTAELVIEHSHRLEACNHAIEVIGYDLDFIKTYENQLSKTE